MAHLPVFAPTNATIPSDTSKHYSRPSARQYYALVTPFPAKAQAILLPEYDKVDDQYTQDNCGGEGGDS